MSDEHKDLLDELYELREECKGILNKEFLQELVVLCEMIDRSYVDAYHGIKERSQYGANCGYAARAKDLFLKMHYQGIKKKITDIYNIVKDR